MNQLLTFFPIYFLYVRYMLRISCIYHDPLPLNISGHKIFKIKEF